MVVKMIEFFIHKQYGMEYQTALLYYKWDMNEVFIYFVSASKSVSGDHFVSMMLQG